MGRFHVEGGPSWQGLEVDSITRRIIKVAIALRTEVDAVRGLELSREGMPHLDFRHDVGVGVTGSPSELSIRAGIPHQDPPVALRHPAL